jgi:glycerophosphoryl diester phosphodiesterase
LALCLIFTSVFAGGSVSYAGSHKAKYIAHRGLSAKAPENTLPAFALAARNSKFYGVEFDVWESTAEKKPAAVVPASSEEGSNPDQASDADSNEGSNPAQPAEEWHPLLLVMHDSNTKRMCGTKFKVQSITRSNLDNFTIIKGKNIRKYPGLKIPTVEQTLDTIWANSRGAIPVIELKHRLSPQGLEYLLTCLGNHKAVVISFDFNAVSDTVKMARKMGISQNIQTMYLRSKLSKKKYSAMARKLKRAGIDCISLKYTAIKKKTVRKFHKSGIKVCAWTLQNKKKARKYARMGVDYITANGVVF